MVEAACGCEYLDDSGDYGTEIVYINGEPSCLEHAQLTEEEYEAWQDGQIEFVRVDSECLLSETPTFLN